MGGRFNSTAPFQSVFLTSALAVGKGKILESGHVRPCDLEIGDKILFGKYSGTEVRVEGEELMVMREEDVMAVIESK
jgi:chaperonin GroES